MSLKTQDQTHPVDVSTAIYMITDTKIATNMCHDFRERHHLLGRLWYNKLCDFISLVLNFSHVKWYINITLETKYSKLHKVRGLCFVHLTQGYVFLTSADSQAFCVATAFVVHVNNITSIIM